MKQNYKHQTIFDKIWSNHLVDQQGDGTCLIYIDRHLVHEVTSPQAFEGLRNANRKVRRPQTTFAVADHNVPTSDRSKGIENVESRIQVETLEQNCKDFEITLFPLLDKRQGIVHIVGPEASNLISEAALAIEMGATLEDIALTIHPHPTLGETMMEAAEATLGHAIHMIQKKK